MDKIVIAGRSNSSTTAQEAVGTTIVTEARIWHPLVSAIEKMRNTIDATMEMTLLWKSQNDFHSSLEISHRTRDSHIPTADPRCFRGEERRMNRPQVVYFPSGPLV
jgi:hypothetical protein